MTNLKTFVADQEIEISYASALQSGYGHKRIEVKLIFNGEVKKFQATTSNMPAYDAATEFEGAEKYHALYEIVERQIIDEVAAWIEEVLDAE